MAESLPPSRPTDPLKSPSYPSRIHAGEGPEWRALLATWQGRVAQARESSRARTSGPDGAAAARLLAQMSGALDQLAEAVRRLPMEVGGMYEEDKLRAEEAVRALERCLDRWGRSAA